LRLEHEGDEPHATDSPHATTQAAGMSLVAILLFALALIMAVATVLIWSIDEQPGTASRGALMLGLAVVALTLAMVLRRRPARPHAAAPRHAGSTPEVSSPANTWRRTGMGSPSTDWIAPLVPIVLVALPATFIANPLDLDFVAKLAVLVGFLELLIFPFFILARREPVGLTLSPGLLLVTRRNGSIVKIPQASIHRLELRTRHVRGFAFHELVIHYTQPSNGPKTLTLREPMDAPLPAIARLIQAHLEPPR
jgi:hypothetical protein